MKLVSVIIPVYKVEKYLDRCIKSVVNQTYKDLEIILVDDGSPDNCPVMCDEWAKKDSRIKVVHKKNGGLSSARNAGLDICTGEYIMFLDSDDWYDIDTVELCVTHMLAMDSDVGVFGIRRCSDDAIISERAVFGEDVYKQMIEHLALESDAVWNKIFKRFLWDNLRFEKGLIFEDRHAMVEIYVQTRKISCLANVYYNYYKNNSGSIMSTIYFDPREPYYRWIVEKHVNDRLGMLVSPAVCNKVRTSAMEHALKSHIIDCAVRCLSDTERQSLADFINDGDNLKVKLKLEYKLYRFSFRHWNVINRVKSIEYVWKYSDLLKRIK